MNVLDRSCKLENRNHALYLTLDELLEKGSFKKVENKEIVKEEKDEQ